MRCKQMLAALLVAGVLVTGCGAKSKGEFNAPWQPVTMEGSSSNLPPVYVAPPGAVAEAPPAAPRAASPDPKPVAVAEAPQPEAVKPPAVSSDPPVAVSAPVQAPKAPPPQPAPAPEPEPQPVQPKLAPEPPAPVPAPAPEKPEPQPEPEPEPQPATPAPKPPVPAPAVPVPVNPAPVAPAPVTPAPQPQVPAPAPAGLTADEALMLKLINEERAKAGLPPFQVDLQVVQTARVKSQDMITYNYFSHDSPRLGSPFDQMKAAGIRYMTAGENIAGNPSVEGAHRSLMNSPGHRANILSRSFTKIGIGILRGGRYGMMFTQQFIG